MLTHGAFTPSTRLHARSFVGVLASASPEVAVRAMAGLPESAVETLTTETPVVTQYVPPLERIARVAPELLREATLPPTLAKVSAIVRAFHGQSLTADEGASALAMAAQLLAYGQQSIAGADDYGRPVPLDPVKLAHTFARLGGPHWIRAFPTPERLPVETAVAALEHESLEEAARAVGLFTYKLLRPRTEPAARFFEVAAKVDADKARYLRVAGVEHARTPDEIPVGAEDAIEPSHVQYEPGFAQLGTARLDAWGARWLATQPDALTTCDEHSAARTLGVWLSRLGKTALPFGDAMRATLLGEPLPYKHSPDDIDLRRYTGEFSSVTPSGAEHVLRVAATKARAREAEGAHPEILKGLRLLICAALAALPAELAVDESIDALVSLGDGLDYDAKNHVRRAVYRLPLVRAEQVVARTANELPDPFEELTYAREGSSEVAMRRFARLVASGRENETMWMRCGGSGGLVSLGPAFGPLLAEALGGETLSESFFTRLGKVVHEGALAHVRQAVGQNVLDLASEMKKLCAELGGEHVVVYAMSVGKPGRGLSRIGGLPAGFAADDVPRGRGRKLMHAFTVDLVEVPELAAKHPGARTLSVWIQGWGEATTRAQSLVPKTEAEIAERPITTDAPALSLLRLEVPLEAFAKNPSERAEYARTLLYRKAGFLLGGPLWLQDGPWAVTPTFVAQYDERIAIGANFGDVGICYSFDDHAEWQCH